MRRAKVALSGGVFANALDVVAGANAWDYVAHTATSIAGTGTTPDYAIDVSALVIHSEDDQIVPYADSAPLTVKLLRKGTLKTFKDLPHGLCQTHPEVVNPLILAFIRGEELQSDQRTAAA